MGGWGGEGELLAAKYRTAVHCVNNYAKQCGDTHPVTCHHWASYALYTLKCFEVCVCVCVCVCVGHATGNELEKGYLI